MRIVICDDQKQIVEKLAGMILEKYEADIESLNQYTDFQMLLSDLEDGCIFLPDILFMDIVFAQGDTAGILAAKAIKDKYPDMQLIFITGYLEQVPNVFMTHPDNVLMKPIEREKLYEALERARKVLHEKETDLIQIKSRGALVILDPNKILFVESKIHELMIHQTDKTEQIRLKMSDFIPMLSLSFIRIHQSYIVNAKYLNRLTREEAVLSDGTILPVSRGKYKDAKEAFGKYLIKKNGKK